VRKNGAGEERWWKARPTANCGGAVCTPNNDPEWQREFGAVATFVQSVAAAAATKNVLIIQAAGNDSRGFCTLAGHTGCTSDPLHLRTHPGAQCRGIRVGRGAWWRRERARRR